MEIFIVFTDTKTYLSRLIKLCTGHSLSHVSIAFDQRLATMCSFGRKQVTNAFIGGFVEEDIHCEMFQRAECAVYKLAVNHEEYTTIQNFIKKIKQNRNNYRYNIIGLFAVLFNVNLNRKQAFFCSQFVAAALLEGNIRISHKPENLIRPCDIQTSTRLELLYQGAMKTYPYLSNLLIHQQEIEEIGSAT